MQIDLMTGASSWQESAELARLLENLRRVRGEETLRVSFVCQMRRVGNQRMV